MLPLQDQSKFIRGSLGHQTFLVKRHKLDAPLGVRGRNSNNDLIREKLGWDYSQTLEEGIRKTYNWIARQVANR